MAMTPAERAAARTKQVDHVPEKPLVVPKQAVNEDKVVDTAIPPAATSRVKPSKAILWVWLALVAIPTGIVFAWTISINLVMSVIVTFITLIVMLMLAIYLDKQFGRSIRHAKAAKPRRVSHENKRAQNDSANETDQANISTRPITIVTDEAIASDNDELSTELQSPLQLERTPTTKEEFWAAVVKQNDIMISNQQGIAERISRLESKLAEPEASRKKFPKSELFAPKKLSDLPARVRSVYRDRMKHKGMSEQEVLSDVYAISRKHKGLFAIALLIAAVPLIAAAWYLFNPSPLAGWVILASGVCTVGGLYWWFWLNIWAIVWTDDSARLYKGIIKPSKPSIQYHNIRTLDNKDDLFGKYIFGWWHIDFKTSIDGSAESSSKGFGFEMFIRGRGYIKDYLTSLVEEN